MRAWGWGEAHNVCFPLALLLCSLLDLYLYGTYKERSPRFSIFLGVLEALTSIYLVQRRNVPLLRTLLWYKLARFYELSSPPQNIPFKRIFLWPKIRTLRAILPNLFPAILTLY